MKSIKLSFSFLVLIFSILLHTASIAQLINQNEYSQRREKLFSMLTPGSAAVFKAAETKVRSSDVSYRYRQESSFLYFTGMNLPNCYLLFSAKEINIDGKGINIFMFIPGLKSDSILAGKNLSQGFFSTAKFQEIFKSVLKETNTLYVSASDFGFVNDWLNDKPIFLERDSKKLFIQKYPGVKLRNVSSLAAQLREIKSDSEINMIRKAISITGDGIKRAMKICKPNGWEYELRGAVEYEMIKQGSDYTSFPSIIGSGPNSLILHYDEDNRQMKNGEVVVMDVGAEYGGYAGDITRTIPVSGKFSQTQKEIYSLVLKAQKEIIKIIKPGVSFSQLDDKAKEVFKTAGLEKFLTHGVSHSVGIDVHDPATDFKLKPGMVITVEPGLYFKEDSSSEQIKYHGFGVRIEDDVLVTENGCEVLSKNIPKEIDEIEKLMK